ncbi:PVC-type heme-binding CxxCH protein [Verrucomicrobiota bacterium sgz303538]
MRLRPYFTVHCVVTSALLGAASAFAEWKPTTIPTQKEITTSEPVWFRCFIRVPDNMTTPQEKDLWRDSITLSVGGVRGPFTLWLNGQKIGEGEALEGDQRRRFKVPKGILESKSFNVLAVQMTGTGAAAGLGTSPILAGYFDELELAGTWETQSGEPAPQELRAVPQQPAIAAFTEAGFHPSSTPLSANPAPMPGARLAPTESLAKMQTPSDLKVELMLSEPQVAQPTQISFDERGRMWVAQYRQYPFPAGLRMISRDKYYRARFDRVPPAPPHHDRGNDVISVHEDTDGDGLFDSHRVVLDGLNMANSVVHGHGGIWVMHTPYLMFYPDANGDDVPDSDPEVRLAGFGLEDTHSVANGLVWGPDGWLYGAQGSTTTSRVVRPGVDPADFKGIYQEGCMVWRYHPKTKAYEIFAEGGGNVFELDFDSEGRLHSGHNGGDTRGWHYVQSGLFLKQGVDPGKFGPPPHPFAFGQLEMLKSRNPIQRFSHATIVADGNALPEHYAGRFFAADPLHRNIVVAERYSRGSTFETSDSATALAGADPSFRPVYLTNAPDGAIYVADFYEEFIAHGQNYQGQIDPSTGRIYRLRGKDSALNKDIDLTKKSTAQLIDLLAHPNRWHRHTAVRLLGEKRDPAAVEPLRKLLGNTAEHPALEALWALHQMEALDETVALSALAHPQAPVRAWAIRLLGDSNKLPEKFAAAVIRLAATEPDAEVRSQIASASRRLPAAQALPLVTALLRRDTDAADPYIPLLCWWTIESCCSSDRDAVLASLDWDSTTTKQVILPRLMRRFAAAGGRNDLLTCARLLESAPTPAHRQLLMTGFEEAFKGRALPALPEPLVQALAQSGFASRYLRVRLGEPEALLEALKVAADEKAKVEERLLCVRLFGEVKLPESVPTLLHLVASSKAAEIRKAALTSLLTYEGATIGEEIARGYAGLPPEVQPAAQTLLTSRPGWSVAFLKLIQSGAVQASTVPPTTATMLREHADKAVASMARNVFATGQSPVKPQAQAERERIRQVLAGAPGDPYKGEPIFMQRCSACHTLFYKGGRIGPNLTAYQRDDLGTLLTSVLDPSAEIREGYVNQIVTTSDNRTLSGFVSDQDASVITFRGLDGQDVSIPRSEVRELRRAAESLMPEGLLNGLSDQELRDFFAYLRIPQPITR